MTLPTRNALGLVFSASVLGGIKTATADPAADSKADIFTRMNCIETREEKGVVSYDPASIGDTMSFLHAQVGKGGMSEAEAVEQAKSVLQLDTKAETIDALGADIGKLHADMHPIPHAAAAAMKAHAPPEASRLFMWPPGDYIRLPAFGAQQKLEIMRGWHDLKAANEAAGAKVTVLDNGPAPYFPTARGATGAEFYARDFVLYNPATNTGHTPRFADAQGDVEGAAELRTHYNAMRVGIAAGADKLGIKVVASDKFFDGGNTVIDPFRNEVFLGKITTDRSKPAGDPLRYTYGGDAELRAVGREIGFAPERVHVLEVDTKKLTDEELGAHFYHLDCCFAVLPPAKPGGKPAVIMADGVLTDESEAQIAKAYGADNIIHVSKEAAAKGAANVDFIGRNVISANLPDKAKKELRARGYNPVTPDEVWKGHAAPDWKFSGNGFVHCAANDLTPADVLARQFGLTPPEPPKAAPANPAAAKRAPAPGASASP